MERLCTDCKHCRREWDSGHGPEFIMRGYNYFCDAMNGSNSAVNGGPIDGMNLDLVRMALCGWTDPKFWEPITSPQSPRPSASST